MRNRESRFLYMTEPTIHQRISDLVQVSVPWTQIKEIDDFLGMCATEFWVFGILAIVRPFGAHKTPVPLDPDKLVHADGAWHMLLPTGFFKRLDPEEVLVIQYDGLSAIEEKDCDPNAFRQHVGSIMAWWLTH